MSDSFINKYRPTVFGQVFGHQAIVGQLLNVFDLQDRPHTYLLSGPSGIGKTTIARLIGSALAADITEIDAASHSGVDDMREVVESSQYSSLQGDGYRLVIIDECHTLSRQAWQTLLKVAEEPPDHFFLALCTTEPDKVPATIRGQRAYHIALRPLDRPQMDHYVSTICDIEQWQLASDVHNLIVSNAEGSPRKALQLIWSLANAPDIATARQIISTIDAGDTAADLCKLLLSGKPHWDKLRPYLNRIEDDTFDAALGHIGNYLVGVICKSTNIGTVTRAGELLLALTFPTETYNKKLQFYAAITRMVQG